MYLTIQYWQIFRASWMDYNNGYNVNITINKTLITEVIYFLLSLPPALALFR